MTITGNKFKTEFFFVAPLEVVKVTSENMEQVAEWCGGRIASAESRRVKGRIDKYVWVPTPKGTQISWAFPGMFITKRVVVTLKDELKETYSVFRRDYFEKNYFASPNEAVDKTWERQATENGRKSKDDQTSKHPHQEGPGKVADVEASEPHVQEVELTELADEAITLGVGPDPEIEVPDGYYLDHDRGLVAIDDELPINISQTIELAQEAPPVQVERPEETAPVVPNHLKQPRP